MTIGSRRDESWAASLGAAAAPWLLSRALVLGALAVARHIVTELAVVPRPIQIGQGLLGWDAAFYGDIANGGYDAVPRSGLRFFPGVSLLGRAIGGLPGLDARAGVVVVANVAALLFLAVLHRLVLAETADAALARRTVWIGALAPPAFVTVMGYAEAPLMLLAVVTFASLRSRRYGGAAAAGFLAGVVRPVGVLLAVPALVEAARDRHRLGPREMSARLLAIAAPGLGLLSYLLWVRARTGDLFLALRIHEDPTLRGGTVEPVGNLFEAAGDLFRGDRVGSGLHFVSALVLIALLVVLLGRWPASYTAYAAVSLGLALTASNLDSLERYSFATFPFLLAVSEVTRRPALERSVLVVAGTGLVVAAILAFVGILIP